jgi:hypothetical protein
MWLESKGVSPVGYTNPGSRGREAGGFRDYLRAELRAFFGELKPSLGHMRALSCTAVLLRHYAPTPNHEPRKCRNVATVHKVEHTVPAVVLQETRSQDAPYLFEKSPAAL